MSDSADRTIPATPRRREAARRQGAMPASASLAWVASAVVVVALLPGWMRATLPAAAEMVRGSMANATAVRADTPALSQLLPMALVAPSLGLVVAAAAAGLAVRGACDGIGWHPGRALPDLSRIDPLSGLRRVFSGRSVLTVIGNAAALLLLASVAYAVAGPLFGAGTVGDPARAAMLAWRQLGWLVAAAAVIAACQYALARLRFEKAIRMTPQEFADEQKSMQADPKVRLMQQKRRAYKP
jgi:flagellar biosynthesis protein FlhB